MAAPVLSRIIDLALPVDLRSTLGLLDRRARTIRVGHGEVWRAAHTPIGAATVRLRSLDPHRVSVASWGPGAAWALEQAPDLVGAADTLDGFDAGRHPLVRELHRRHPGLRMTRTAAVVDAAVPAILEQKVVAADARRSYRRLLARTSSPAPGPWPANEAQLRLPPTAAALSAVRSWEWHRCGVEAKRADTIARVARDATRLDATAALPAVAAAGALRQVRGVGPWTAAEITHVTHADADAVSVGDYHLHNTVTYALTGEPRGDDERMLELLADWPGHRGRVTRLLELSGHAPRYGPRMPRQDIALL